MESDEEPANSGEDDWDDSLLYTDWAEDYDAIPEPKCSKPECGSSNLHFSGSLIICLGCRSVESSHATDSPEAAFPYRTLQEDSEFRLLLIWPPRDDQDEVHCSLTHGLLNTHIEYDAISYTWADETGDDSRSRHVFIDGVPLPVTASCEAVLKRTRLRSTAKVLWIDAVCINQDDKDERGHQVRLMPDIYSHAKKVLIFPGEATEEESRGLYYFADLDTFQVYEQLCKGEIEGKLDFDIWKSVQQTVRHLFSRRYFTRVWILQEIALAKEPIVMYGKYQVPWHKIRTEIIQCAKRPLSRSERHLLPPKEPLPTALTLGTATIRGPSDLLDLLDQVGGSHAQDPRDKVFALFGMIQFASSFGFVANYNESVEESFTRVAMLLAARNGLMPILARSIGSEPPIRQGLPPWVPDWSMSRKRGTTEPRDGFKMLQLNLKSPNTVRVLARPAKYEMDIVGAWACDLATLVFAKLHVRILTTSREIVEISLSTDIESAYEALNVPRGRSLSCYLVASTAGNPESYLDEQHLDHELRELQDMNSRGPLIDRLCDGGKFLHTFFLSSGIDSFCFAGICQVRPEFGGSSMDTRPVSWSTLRRRVPDSGVAANMMRYLRSSLVHLVSTCSAEDHCYSPTPTATTFSGEAQVCGWLTGLVGIAREGKSRGPIKCILQPGDSTIRSLWLDAWLQRELCGLESAILRTPEGQELVRALKATTFSSPAELDDILPVQTLAEIFDISLDGLLGDASFLEFQRLTFRMTGYEDPPPGFKELYELRSTEDEIAIMEALEREGW